MTASCLIKVHSPSSLFTSCISTDLFEGNTCLSEMQPEHLLQARFPIPGQAHSTTGGMALKPL